MKRKVLILTSLILSLIVFAQDKIEKQTRPIVEEGKKLYRSEMASWYGTDLFLEKFTERRNNIGGYFSYNDGNIAKCIFFSKGKNPIVIGTISFDETYDLEKAKIDGKERKFSSNEFDLYEIRQLALEEIRTDTLFKTYENANLNLIPLIDKGTKKVYVLTGPKEHGNVIIGNDYLLTFDKSNKLLTKKSLHKNIMPIKYTEGEEGITMHTHLPETGDFITATDICTLMLYEKFANWKQHIVISDNYVCLWDCKKDQLFTLTKEAWNNIYKNSEERNK